MRCAAEGYIGSSEGLEGLHGIEGALQVLGFEKLMLVLLGVKRFGFGVCSFGGLRLPECRVGSGLGGFRMSGFGVRELRFCGLTVWVRLWRSALLVLGS